MVEAGIKRGGLIPWSRLVPRCCVGIWEYWAGLLFPSCWGSGGDTRSMTLAVPAAWIVRFR